MDLGRLAPASEVTGGHFRKGLPGSANFKMVWYVLLRPLRPELDGQDPFQISGLLSQTRKTPTLVVAATTKPRLGRLAPTSEVAGEHTIPF
jgi:hypothetical protein